MSSKSTVDDLLEKILLISQSPSQIPHATQHDLIYQQFSCPPIVSADEEDEGIWYVVNKNMDSLFGAENYKKNIKRGKFGIEVVLEYLKKARQNSLWNADELLELKLVRICEYFERASLIINSFYSSALC
jgi:hypothetical protein